MSSFDHEGSMMSDVDLNDYGPTNRENWRHRRDVRALTIADLAPGDDRERSRAQRRPHENLRDRLNREHAELSEALLVLAGQLARRERQLEHLARYPADDPFPDGTRLEFEKKFPNSDRRYTYLALRADGRWYPTGLRSPGCVNWSGLVDLMGLGVDEVWKIGPRGGRKKVIG